MVRHEFGSVAVEGSGRAHLLGDVEVRPQVHVGHVSVVVERDALDVAKDDVLGGLSTEAIDACESTASTVNHPELQHLLGVKAAMASFRNTKRPSR